MAALAHAAARIKFRQHRLLPSGCMQRKGFNLHVVGGDVHGKYFAFCSTLAVYVYDMSSFQLHRLLSTADNLAGLAWCTSHQYGHWLATVSLSRKVVLYDVETEQILYDVLLPHHAVSFQWHPAALQLIVATADPMGKASSAATLLEWTIDHPNRSTSLNVLRRNSPVLTSSPVTVIRFNSAGALAIGFENGNIAIHNEKDPTLRLLDKKKPKKQAPPGSPSSANAIIDLQWDSLSTIYLLVATRDGRCALWEVTDDTGAPLHTFDKQGSGTSAIAWLPWGSGLFVTANARTGNLKLWNVSQTTPLDHIRVRPSGVGVHGMALLPSSQHLVCASSDGSIALYQVPRRQLAWQSQAGHKETIFDLRFQPMSAHVLATCGHDGAVRVWNTSTMECTHHLQPQEAGGIAYSVAWSPTNANRIASASSMGTVHVWDLATLAPTLQFSHHTDAIYCVSWRVPSTDPRSPVHARSSMLASSSKDKSIVIFQDIPAPSSASRGDGGPPHHILRRYLLPCPASGCAWRPGDSGILAVGGGDHFVRLFDVDNADMDAPVRILAAHDARVFHTVWYPYQSTHGWLATSSDDCTVRVWTLPPLQPFSKRSGDDDKQTDDVASAAVVPYVTLKGHSNYVRALVWSTAAPDSHVCTANPSGDDRAQAKGDGDDAGAPPPRPVTPLLLSGSWDSTIRIWDVEKRECRLVVSDHLADVYGIATHPSAPSVFVSCSRDTTVRFWGLSTPATQELVLRTMLRMTPSTPFEQTTKLAAVVAEHSSAASSGVANLMALLHEQQQRSSSSASSPKRSSRELPAATTAAMVVPAEDRLLAVAMEHARRLECGHGRRSKPTKLNQGDSLRQAARQYLKAGAVQKYCQLLVDVDDWEPALAMAPAVSMAYWQELAAKYAEVLQAKEDEAAVSYYLATHQVAKAAQVLQSRGQFNDACVVAKAHTNMAFSPPALDGAPSLSPPRAAPASPKTGVESDDVLAGQAKGVDATTSACFNQRSLHRSGSCDDATTNAAQDVSARRLLHTTYAWLADLYSGRGEPVLAACCHLAVAQVDDAVDRLVRGDELELAWMLCRWHGIAPSDLVVAAVVGRCEALGDGALALAFAQALSRPQDEMALTYARLNRPMELRRLAQVPDTPELERSLDAFIANHQVVDAIRTCVLLDRTTQAVDLATKHLHAHLASSNSLAVAGDCESLQLLLGITHVLRSTHFADLDPKPRAQALAYMALAGALRAIDARYPLVLVSYLLQVVHTQVHCYTAPFPISTAELLLLEAQYASRIDATKASVLLTQVATTLASSDNDGRGRDSTTSLHDQVETLQRQLQSQPRDLWIDPAYTRGAVVVSGARLPSAGQTRHPVISILTGEVIHGPFVRLEDDVSALTLEEAIMWHRVNPFSPLSTGDKLRLH